MSGATLQGLFSIVVRAFQDRTMCESHLVNLRAGASVVDYFSSAGKFDYRTYFAADGDSVNEEYKSEQAVNYMTAYVAAHSDLQAKIASDKERFAKFWGVAGARSGPAFDASMGGIDQMLTAAAQLEGTITAAFYNL